MTATPEIKPNIKRFRVEGLFGRHTLELPFQDNRLIIVGENGSGKSTVVNMLYYLLTRQWSKLRTSPFSRLELQLEGGTVEIDREKLVETSINTIDRSPFQAGLLRMSERHVEAFLEELTGIDLDDITSHDRLMVLSERSGLSPRHLIELARPRSTPATRGGDDYLESLRSLVDSNVNCQILFLPTYRRIERDLQALFPDIPVERELQRWRRSRNPRRKGGYLELVEFGMQDVEEAFKETTQRLDREFRAELNNLTGEYLRDIIRSEYQSAPAERFLAPAVPAMVTDILGRMDERILPRKEQYELKTLIGKVQTEQTIHDNQRVVLHFVSKLIRIHEEQRKREERVTKLMAVCNRYLSHKRLQFDSQQFDLYLARGKEPDQGTERIPASGLSSGEKQIVSLFTHIYLSDATGYFVIIDEPELSISVPWQRKFLEDIVETDLCHGLVAVTHSPFIFENSLSNYARSMAEFLQS